MSSLLRFAAALLAASLAWAAQAQDIAFPRPRVAGFNEILNNGDKEVSTFRFARHARVYIVDFMTLAQQGATFNRIAAFIERHSAPRDRVLSEEEFRGYLQAIGKTPDTLSYGNNFTVGNLVVFFNVADDKGVPLNASERALLNLLLDQQLVFKRTGFYQPRDADAVVLSIPRAGVAPASQVAVTPQIRSSILRHELGHAEFYLNSRYAEFCRTFWRETLTDEQRNAFRDFLTRATYDTSLEDVVINEWQAYLAHTPDKTAFNAARVGLKEEELEQMRDAFRKQSASAGVILSLF